MPSVGDLFVDLGVKGSDKTLGALTETKKGMGELASTSLEARAAMVAAAYAFERLMSSSSNYGTSLKNSNLLLGTSTKDLQKYQYAARVAGASVEELNGSFKRLSDIANNIHLGKGAPESLKSINMLLGKDAIDARRIDDLPYMVQKLQQVATNTKLPPGLRRHFLEDMLGSDNMVAAVVKQGFSSQILNAAPVYSPGQIAQLDKARSTWEKIAIQVERIIGNFNSRHGVQLADEIGGIVTSLGKFAEAADALAERLKVFEGFAIVMSGLAGSMQIIANLSSPKKETREAERHEIGSFFSDLKLMMSKYVVDSLNKAALPQGALLPRPGLETGPSGDVHITLEQNFGADVANNPRQLRDASRNGVKDAADTIWGGSGQTGF